MANMDHYGASTPPVNPNLPISDFPHLPQAGWFPVGTLAQLVGSDSKTVRNWILKHNCPYKQPGKEMWVDVQDVWKSWPYHKPDDTPRKRGRKPKEE